MKYPAYWTWPEVQSGKTTAE